MKNAQMIFILFYLKFSGEIVTPYVLTLDRVARMSLGYTIICEFVVIKGSEVFSKLPPAFKLR